ASSPALRQITYLSIGSLFVSASNVGHDRSASQMARHPGGLGELDALLGLCLSERRRERGGPGLLCFLLRSLPEPLGRDRWGASYRRAVHIRLRLELRAAIAHDY